MSRTTVMDNRFFNECVIRDELSKLRAVLRAIPKWERIAVTEVQKVERLDTTRFSDLQHSWHESRIVEEYELLDDVSEHLHAGLAVGIASAIEKIFGMLCAEYEQPLPQRPQWGHKRSAIQRILRSRIDRLPGCDSATRARLLGNCFKHSEGKMNRDWVRKFGGSAGEDIRYADEDWKAMIDGSQQFLLALVAALPLSP